MSTTPFRRSLLLTPLVLAMVASGSVAPAQARTTTASRMPVPTFSSAPHSPTTVVTPPGEATTVGGVAPPTWPTPVRRFTRLPAVDPMPAEVVRLVNVARADAGCPAVRSDARLATAARLHSEDMARRNYFSHTSLDGRSPWDRIRAQGYAYGSAENIAAGQRTPAEVMSAWMKSPGHQANILNCSNVAIGVGIGHGGSYGIYWTQDFGSR